MKRIIKWILWVVLGLGFLLAVAISIGFYLDNRQVPMDLLEFKDDSILGYWQKGELTGFKVRVSNKSDLTITRISFRLDIVYRNPEQQLSSNARTIRDRILAGETVSSEESNVILEEVNASLRAGSLVDGAEFTIYEVIPPKSTRMLEKSWLNIKHLPPKNEWTYEFTPIEANAGFNWF